MCACLLLFHADAAGPIWMTLSVCLNKTCKHIYTYGYDDHENFQLKLFIYIHILGTSFKQNFFETKIFFSPMLGSMENT